MPSSSVMLPLLTRKVRSLPTSSPPAPPATWTSHRPSGLRAMKVDPRPMSTGWVTWTCDTRCPATYRPLVDPRSVTTIPLEERSIRAWCLEMSGSSRTRVLSGARPMVPEEVTRKDVTVCLEVGKAPELAELDEGGAGRPGGAT